jgi:hypothetical protein
VEGWHDEHRLCRPKNHTLGDRPRAQQVEPGSLMRAHDDEIVRTRVQQDDACWIAVLHACVERHTRRLGTQAQARDELCPLASLRPKALRGRNGMDDRELAAVLLGEQERTVERGPCRFRKIHGDENAHRSFHCWLPLTKRQERVQRKFDGYGAIAALVLARAFQSE